MRKVLLIYGPTAAGKSTLALALAQKHGGEIINADSLQIYEELKLLSARPSHIPVPHHLYGFMSARLAYSVGDWLCDCLAAIDKTKGLPIVVGGTGLYFQALTQGLSLLPAADPIVRATYQDQPIEELRARLKEVDRAWFDFIQPQDRQRTIRGLEVYETSGIKLSDWQKKPRQAPQGLHFIHTALCPDRALLVKRAEARLEQMVAQGVLEEVAALAALNLPADRTALKALGFAELHAHLQGELPLAEAMTLAKARTRHYIRRQRTWLNNKMSAYQVFPTSEALEKAINL